MPFVVVQLQRQEGGVTREGKEQFVRFNYEGPSMSLMMATPVKAAKPALSASNSPSLSHSKRAEDEDKMEVESACGAKEAGSTEEKTEAVPLGSLPVAAATIPTASAAAPPTALAAPAPLKGDCKVLDDEPLTYVDQQCSICLCEYEHGDELCMLPCYHAFHDDCISVWVTNHSKCPLCLRDLNDTTPSRDQQQIEIEMAQ